MEDATTPEIYKDIERLKRFPEERIGKCFEIVPEMEATMSELAEGYDSLSKSQELHECDRRIAEETAKTLKDVKRRWVTRTAQWYADLQFNERVWNRAYKLSITATATGIAVAAYSLSPALEKIQTSGITEALSKYTNTVGLFLASAIWTIASGTAIYTFTDAGPKTARFLRKLDERIIRYRWV